MKEEQFLKVVAFCNIFLCFWLFQNSLETIQKYYFNKSVSSPYIFEGFGKYTCLYCGSVYNHYVEIIISWLQLGVVGLIVALSGIAWSASVLLREKE